MAADKPQKEYYALDSLNWHFNFWTFLGIEDLNLTHTSQKILYKLYGMFIQFAVNVYFPFSLIYGLFQLKNPRDILENVAISVAVLTCGMKSYVIRGKIKDIRALGEISKAFEKEAKLNDQEYSLITEFRVKSQKYLWFFLFSFGSLVVSGFMIVVTFDTRRLMYPGYFPYDFTQTRLIYGATLGYQWACLSIHVVGNVHFDSFPGLLTFLMCQHLRILDLRITKIGYDPECTYEENNQFLKKAVNDHRQIIEFYKTVNHAISATNFALFLSSSFNIVCCVVVMSFFADNVFQKIYYVNLIFCYGLETALSCYYGSEFEEYISSLTNSLYSCHWYDQPKNFKKDFVIFMECSLRKYEFMAGGLVPVNKGTFVRMMRATFSLFTVLNGLREKFN